MAMKLYSDTDVQAIANAIRAKNGSSDTYTIGEMAAAINAIPTGGSSKNIQVEPTRHQTSSASYVNTGLSITVDKTGTYNVYWSGWRSTGSGTSGSRLYKNGTALGTAHTTFTSSYGQNITETNISLNAGDVITIYARARSSSYYMYVCNLVIVEQ